MLDQAIAQETDGPDLTLRLAALLHDIGKPATRRFEEGGGVSFHHHEVVGAKLVRKRLRALRMPKALIDDVAMLTFLHLRFHGYGTGAWTDSAVRRYVTDAGELLPRLHKLVRADCTTRNPGRRQALQRSYDDLEARIARIAAAEDLARVRPDLDGNAIMALLGVPPGPIVGKAWAYLKELRLERGPLDRDAAEAALLEWAAREGSSRRPTRRPMPAVTRLLPRSDAAAADASCRRSSDGDSVGGLFQRRRCRSCASAASPGWRGWPARDRGRRMSSSSLVGTTCQDRPNRSLSQPHWLSSPPSVSLSSSGRPRPGRRS